MKQRLGLDYSSLKLTMVRVGNSCFVFQLGLVYEIFVVSIYMPTIIVADWFSCSHNANYTIHSLYCKEISLRYRTIV